MIKIVFDHKAFVLVTSELFFGSFIRSVIPLRFVLTDVGEAEHWSGHNFILMFQTSVALRVKFTFPP